MRQLLRLSIVPAALIAAPALAHSGHGIGGGFGAGFLHPLTGWDHLSAMLLIGAWTAMPARAAPAPADRRAPLGIVTSFLVAMFAGFASGAMFQAGTIEWAVTISVAVAAIAVIARWRAPLPISMTLVAMFGFAHGQAHGVDVPDIAPIMRFAGGFLLASSGLLVIGMIAARSIPRATLALARTSWR